MVFLDELTPHAALEPSFTFPSSFVLPRYGGGSVANLPPSIGQLLGTSEGWAGPPLDASLLDPLGKDIERVILLLVDGVGWDRLNEQLARDDAGFHDILAQCGVLKAPITTVAPATTSVATTTVLCDGSTPAEHGMLGYSFLLGQRGVVANALFWHPVGKKNAEHGELEAWGLNPETFLSVPSTAEVLAHADIPMRVVMPGSFQRSPLSRMRPRGAEVDGYLNSVDMWLKLGQWLEDTAGRKAYAYAYYADFDSLSHRDGKNAVFWDALWREFVFHLKQFIGSLSARQRRGTLLLLTADHGHVVTPPHERTFLQDHPTLMELSTLPPGGEPRQTYWYARPGCKADLLAYAREALIDDFIAIDAAEALAAGLYGDPNRLHPDASRRLGDMVLLAKGPHTLWDAADERIMLGMHASLEAEEMVVPLIGLRL